MTRVACTRQVKMTLKLTSSFAVTRQDTNEARHKKKYLLTCKPKEDTNQPAHVLSMISFRFPHEKNVVSMAIKMQPVKILMNIPQMRRLI